MRKNRLDRKGALQLYTMGSSWFSGDEGKKGSLAVGQLADLAVLSADYFNVPEEDIKEIESVMTIMDGRIVYGNDEFKDHAPALPPVSPDWAPTGVYGGAYRHNNSHNFNHIHNASCSCSNPLHQHTHSVLGENGIWGIGCTCFAF